MVNYDKITNDKRLNWNYFMESGRDTKKFKDKIATKLAYHMACIKKIGVEVEEEYHKEYKALVKKTGLSTSEVFKESDFDMKGIYSKHQYRLSQTHTYFGDIEWALQHIIDIINSSGLWEEKDMPWNQKDFQGTVEK